MKLTNEEILSQFKIFDKDKFSLILSTTSTNNEPHTNYAPFVKDENGNYYISVSKNLPHFINMVETKKGHVLIIEDEVNASHIYARKRLYFSVYCEVIENTSFVFDLFKERYGDKLSFLKTMKDFRVVKLTPKERSLVLGFGAAYKMDSDGEIINKTISHGK